jgi:hypothetical protein
MIPNLSRYSNTSSIGTDGREAEEVCVSEYSQRLRLQDTYLIFKAVALELFPRH